MVTLEINSTGIKLMETNGRKVIRWASHSLEPGIFQEQVISNPEALGATVKQLMTSSGVSKKKVVASVSGLYSLSRIVMVSTPLGHPVTKEAVIESAQEVMPLTVDELYLSWRTISTGGGGHKVLVVGVPRDVIDSEMQALRAAGISPHTLDLTAMALARAVNKERALILNIEPSTLDIIIVVNGIAEIMHTTSWQKDDLSEEERAEHLASTIELTVGFYNSRRPVSPVDSSTPLYVTGQMSGDFALVEKLQAMIEYPIKPLEPPLECPEHMPISQYAVNIGLALKGIAIPKNADGGGYSSPDINLLPEAYQPWKPSPRQLQAAGAILVALVLLFPLYSITSGAMAKTSILRTRYNVINGRLQQMQLEIKNREPLKKAIGEYQLIVDMGGGFTNSLKTIYSEAKNLDIKIDTATRDSKAISINCAADNYTAFRSYVTALEDSGMFSSPIPPPEGYPYIKSGTIKLQPKTK